jgi:hypothetical protein
MSNTVKTGGTDPASLVHIHARDHAMACGAARAIGRQESRIIKRP